MGQIKFNTKGVEQAILEAVRIARESKVLPNRVIATREQAITFYVNAIGCSLRDAEIWYESLPSECTAEQ